MSDRTGSRQLHRVRVGGGEAEVLTDWRGEISAACHGQCGLVTSMLAEPVARAGST